MSFFFSFPGVQNWARGNGRQAGKWEEENSKTEPWGVRVRVFIDRHCELARSCRPDNSLPRNEGRVPIR